MVFECVELFIDASGCLSSSSQYPLQSLALIEVCGIVDVPVKLERNSRITVAARSSAREECA